MAIVGAAGSIGEALSQKLSSEYDVLAITSVDARARAGDPSGAVQWRYCDLFSLSALRRALSGVRFAIFLAHSGLPNSRLQQAKAGDMDLLMAENFARAAEANRVAHVFCLRSLLPPGGKRGEAQRRHQLIGEILASCESPLTIIRAGLIIEPGSAIVRMIRNQVRHSRFVPVPVWSLRKLQPIALDDLANAFSTCLGRPAEFVGDFDVGGPDLMDWQALLQRAADQLGCEPRFVQLRHLPPSVYLWWLRRLRPAVHPDVLKLVIETLHFDTVVRDNALQRAIAADLRPALAALRSPDDSREVRRAVRFRSSLLRRHSDQLRESNTVRSIQRVELPAGHDTAWLARYYFEWLGAYLRPLIRCDADAGASHCIRLAGFNTCLLRLDYQPDHSSVDRQLFFVKGGLLASRSRNGRGRMEFRAVLGGKHALIAIHEFAPALPWHFYLATQAAFHRFVMGTFERHMATQIK